MRLALAVLASVLSFPAFALAPNYPPLRVDVGVFGAVAPSGVKMYGGGGYVEPKLNITDHLSAGLRFEGSAMFPENIGVTTGATTTSVSMGMRASSAYLLKADWYLTTSSVRPFVGIGAGLYKIGGVSQSAGTSGVVQQAEAFDGFGFAPQVGINLGAFRLAAIYHVLTGGDQVVVTQAVGGSPVEKTISKNWLAIEVGGTFGGSRKPVYPAPSAPAAYPAQQ